jgi:predicted Rossmann-fold nucleotide-binding protein
MSSNTIDASITPERSLEVLSQYEVNKLRDKSENGDYELLRRCCLAVLNSGSDQDDVKYILELYKNFEVRVVQESQGFRLYLKNAPARAFVDGMIIKGIQEHLFAVLRDIVYVRNQIEDNQKFDLSESHNITNAVFHMLRNSKALQPQDPPNLVVCWGGHSIKREEYEYTKNVGYELGLRGLNICTGCGPGAMKGPMKGATIGHSKQRLYKKRYIGITEPGIIAAEAPNPIVNELVIMPDIEKRLEAFVRIGHAFIVFPGGVGTTEEILYLLGILLHPDNSELPFPLILTGPRSSENYFQKIHQFLGATLGYEAQQRYKIIIGDPALVAREIKKGIQTVTTYRTEKNDAYYFNWMLKIEKNFQVPFRPTHENMAHLNLDPSLARHELAANLRCAFSGIVAGNVRAEGIRAIEQHGPFNICGDPILMKMLDDLLDSFVKEHRMKIEGNHYTPCYRIACTEGSGG